MFTTFVSTVLPILAIGAGVSAVLAFLLLRYIPNDRVGIVENLVSRGGSVRSGLVALAGESGFQPPFLDHLAVLVPAAGEVLVWSTPLLPGKYAFNTYAGKVIVVPTTNIILKWIGSQVGFHRLDENLSEVGLITRDAFEPSLPLSVVMHIDYKKAPLVIQRFGDIKKLVEQTLDPMVSAYFKNIGQTKTLIELIHGRSAIQTMASQQMKERFDHYNLELEEVLIGTPTSGESTGPIEQILTQLRSRQLAEEQVETYQRQEKAAVMERELREAEARAKQQTTMTESEIAITVHGNQGKADYQRSIQQAATIQALAEAEAGKIRAIGEAEADRTARVGVAQAVAIDEQVKAYGGPRYQVTQQVMSRLAQAIEQAHVDVVPKVLISGADGAGATANLFPSLLSLLLSEKVGGDGKNGGGTSPQVEAMAKKLRRNVSGALGRPADSGGHR